MFLKAIAFLGLLKCENFGLSVCLSENINLLSNSRGVNDTEERPGTMKSLARVPTKLTELEG